MLNIICVYMRFVYSDIYILYYINVILHISYDLNSMNDKQVIDTRGSRCDRDREGEYIQEKTYITYIPSFSLVSLASST